MKKRINISLEEYQELESYKEKILDIINNETVLFEFYYGNIGVRSNSKDILDIMKRESDNMKILKDTNAELKDKIKELSTFKGFINNWFNGNNNI